MSQPVRTTACRRSHTIAGEPVLEGKYHLECRLGQGGMGVVYKARHAYLKTLHAIKVILPDLVGNDPQLVTRFRQEALAAAAIRHQNVVSVSDYGVIAGTVPFLVMEYVEGESLHDLLAREKKLSPERALDLMAAICAGVGAAHHQGIVHRDLKPLNIMICSDRPNLVAIGKDTGFRSGEDQIGRAVGIIHPGADDRTDGLAVLHGAGAVGGRRSGFAIGYLFAGRDAFPDARRRRAFQGVVDTRRS